MPFIGLTTSDGELIRVFSFDDDSDLSVCNFSNLSPGEVVIDGIKYKRREHAFQAQKFEEGNRKKFADITNDIPVNKLNELKELVWFNKKSLPKGWYSGGHHDAMYKVVKAFAIQNEFFRNQLLATDDVPIVYDNFKHEDKVWGYGSDGRGKNRLGKILMQVRGELRGERSSKAIEEADLANKVVKKALKEIGVREALLQETNNSRIRVLNFNEVISKMKSQGSGYKKPSEILLDAIGMKRKDGKPSALEVKRDSVVFIFGDQEYAENFIQLYYQGRNPEDKIEVMEDGNLEVSLSAKELGILANSLGWNQTGEYLLTGLKSELDAQSEALDDRIKNPDMRRRTYSDAMPQAQAGVLYKNQIGQQPDRNCKEILIDCISKIDGINCIPSISIKQDDKKDTILQVLLCANDSSSNNLVRAYKLKKYANAGAVYIDYTQSNGLGWVVEFDRQEAIGLLRTFGSQSPEEVFEKIVAENLSPLRSNGDIAPIQSVGCPPYQSQVLSSQIRQETQSFVNPALYQGGYQFGYGAYSQQPLSPAAVSSQATQGRGGAAIGYGAGSGAGMAYASSSSSSSSSSPQTRGAATAGASGRTGGGVASSRGGESLQTVGYMPAAAASSMPRLAPAASSFGSVRAYAPSSSMSATSSSRAGSAVSVNPYRLGDELRESEGRRSGSGGERSFG